MKKVMLKVNSCFLVILGIVVVAGMSVILFPYLLSPSTPNSFDDLGKWLACIFSIPLYCIFIFVTISGILSWCYLKKSRCYKPLMFFSIFDCTVFFCVIILSGILSINQKFNFSKQFDLSSIMILLVAILFFCPLFFNIVGIFMLKNNLTIKALWNRYKKRILSPIIILVLVFSFVFGAFLYRQFIINPNKIEITDVNMHTYSEFRAELTNRKFIYKLPPDTSLFNSSNIMAQDSNHLSGYYFSENSNYSGAYFNKKFPLFSYDSYTSVVKKINKNSDYYHIGLYDYYVTWYIYYVDGDIYAAINQTNGINTSLAKQELNLVVSEKDEITIYNPFNDYFVKGGGILSTETGNLLTPLPTTTDISNEQCYKIRSVKKVDAQTLDRISKDLYLQYGEE